MLREILFSASAVMLFASSGISQEVSLTKTETSPTAIVKKYESADPATLDLASKLELAEAYNASGSVENAAKTYDILYTEGTLAERDLAKYGLVLLKLKRTDKAKEVFEKYALTNAEEAGYFLDICSTVTPQTRTDVPPRAIRISDIPAYRNYPQVVSETQAIAVSNRTVEIERVSNFKDVLAAPKAKKEALDISLAKRVSVNELFPVATNVYFIQLASLSRSKGDVHAFKKLVSLGNIYKVKQGGVTKIKLGYFYDQWEAENILASVKNEGYGDAFITEDNLNTGALELALSSHDVVDNSSTTSSTSYTTTTSSTPSYTDNVYETVYKVRLASYEDPIWFDLEKARKMGQIEQWTKGSWTIFILSGFNTYSEAQDAKERAIQRGFVDAEVVMDNGGVLESM